MNLIRVNVALDQESKELLHEEARRHRLSLSAWLRVLAQIMKLPAPADMPMSLLRSQVHEIIEKELMRPRARGEPRRPRGETISPGKGHRVSESARSVVGYNTETGMRHMVIRMLGERDGWRCHWCGAIQCDWVIDHLVPRSKGGPTEMSNLVLACPKCNAMKGADIWTRSPNAQQ